MRYAQIRSMDTSNGRGVGVSLFLQGCSIRCKGCHNSSIWDFNGGKEWNDNIEHTFMDLINRPHITRVSILGGEPMDQALELTCILDKIKKHKPNINIWLYSGYTYEHILQDTNMSKALEYVDYLVDGQFVEKLKDLKLSFMGSSNQRIWEHKNGIWEIIKE